MRQGDLVLVDFDPQVGHEQRGKRPALVVSGTDHNERSSFVIVCPLTRSTAPWRYKVPFDAVGPISGFVIADQVKSIDRRRALRHLGAVADEVVETVRGIVSDIIGVPAR